ncbi:MAG: mannitol-1-phosphate 5-dehydrogenase [Treponemataceae bacterium]|nr:MAG: mannitol-1-phosphate 5-dehydrogenase [Treponemataceae bacterium]
MPVRKALHYGAGNIGRGFIGEILTKNGFHVDFADVNDDLIAEINARQTYTTELATAAKEQLIVRDFGGIDNDDEPEKAIEAISECAILTTAIGPNVLPLIAPQIAAGLRLRMRKNTDSRICEPLDIIACENMIGGSTALKTYVLQELTAEEKAYIEKCIGFPDAAVDRIVPNQKHADPLFVSVGPFYEWVIAEKMCKTPIRLDGAEYVQDLEPFIERKLFTVNTGHAAVAYTGFLLGFTTIGDAIADERVLRTLQEVLAETGALLIEKWHFDKDAHQSYINTIIKRFQNPYISDDISRVARTPLRKLGYDERFIRPLREAKARSLPYKALAQCAASVFCYEDKADAESVKLAALMQSVEKGEKTIEDVIHEVTKLSDATLVAEIAEAYRNRMKKADAE